MDDQQLDDSIRKKVAKFEGEDYDPAAFAALRFRTESPNLPFYPRYRTEVMMGSAVALATLIILVGQWLIANAGKEGLQQKLEAQDQQITKLQQELQHWKTLPPDTVYIVDKKKDVYRYQYLLNRIAALEAEQLKPLANTSATPVTETEIIMDDDRQYFTSQNNSTTSFGSRIKNSPRLNNKEGMKAEPRKSNTSARAVQQLSARTMRDIEKHYHPGIGIRVGPVVELIKGNIKGGNGNLSTCAGILADFILSPSLSLESGVKYGHRDYSYNRPWTGNIALPATDQTLGNLTKAEIDSWIIEIPLAVKYRYPITFKTNALVSIGYSALIFRQQAFDYSYEFDNNNDIFINAMHESKTLKFYPGTVNISLGLSHQIKDQRLEASVGFQKGIQSMGLEKTQANFISLKTVLWFTLK